MSQNSYSCAAKPNGPLGTRFTATDWCWNWFRLEADERTLCTWDDLGLTGWSVCGRRRALPQRQEPRDTAMA